MPITKGQFIKGTIDFIHRCKRLPYLQGDDVEVEIKTDDGEMESRPFRANRYIKEYFVDQDKMSTELISSGELTYSCISKLIGVDVKLLESAIDGSLKEIDSIDRICIENFFNKDYFPKQEKYANECKSCKNTCKQKYNVVVMQCKDRSTKTKKK